MAAHSRLLLVAITLVFTGGQTFAQETTTEDVRTAIRAASADQDCYVIEGMIEESDINEEKLVIHRNSDANLQIDVSSIVKNSISALSHEELDRTIPEFDGVTPQAERKVGDWFRLKIKRGSKCTLQYKTVKVDFIWDPVKQRPFYIDTKSERVVYLKEAKAENNEVVLVDCSNPSKRCNQRVYGWDCKCCCRNRSKECYGYVGCDDGWRKDYCCPPSD